MMSPMRGHAVKEYAATYTASIIMGSGDVDIALPYEIMSNYFKPPI